MPRYCAVKVCSNRGGTASRHDNKRISFYPFPLQDKSRLQEWVDNMKREEWTPSRHQYLCSEHFTEDCFDIRWGIRYLKNTAVPTMFPSTEEDGENKVTSSERSPNAKTGTLDNDFEPTRLDSPPLRKRPLILRRTCKKVQSSTRNNTVVENTGTIFETPPVSDTDISCHLNLSEVQTSACEIVKPSPVSFLPPSPHIEPHSEEHAADSTVTVLCCESLGPLSNGEANMDALRTALGQAFSLVPMEMVNGCYWEAGGPSEGEHISACEHSYCRADTDKEQLWSKILSLHAKLMELDQREQSTVAKIRELETEMALLKRDGAAFKERQKVLEDCISSVLI